jgi:N-carbamoyl-L-amino-acid hydrolase
MAVTIDAARFLRDLNDLRAIGAYRTGVHRPTYAPDDMRSRAWLCERLTECGLQAEIDGIGNVWGLGRNEGPRLLSGSHIESQNQAGWLDGALGVVAAVALARAGLAVDVVAWADEEGHYGSFIGSRSGIGLLEEAEIDRLANRYHGKPLRQALEEAGLAGRPRRQVPQGRYRGFLEMHIEQGRTLEAEGKRAGVVTGIVAIWQYRIRVFGQQNHAGTTMMWERKDAGLAAVRLAAAIDQSFPRLAGPRTVWTTGRMAFEPGAASIIPGAVEMLFQFRDIDLAVLERLQAELERLVAEANDAGPCRLELEVLSRSTPALCDEGMMAALDAAAERHAPGAWRRMPSGAGHDAQYLARVMPAAMLFTPSIGGISHHWTEDTKPEDLALCCAILATAAETLLA